MSSSLFHPSRGLRVGRGMVFNRGGLIGPSFFNSLEDLHQQIGWSIRHFKAIENLFIKTLAYTHVSYALKESYGRKANPLSPSAGAWQIPVRRITENYLYGWKVRKIANAIWFVYNDSREGYFIEYGIHTSPRRVPRPVLKRTAIQTVRFVQKSRMGYRVAGMVAPHTGKRVTTQEALNLQGAPAYRTQHRGGPPNVVFGL